MSRKKLVHVKWPETVAKDAVPLAEAVQKAETFTEFIHMIARSNWGMSDSVLYDEWLQRYYISVREGIGQSHNWSQLEHHLDPELAEITGTQWHHSTPHDTLIELSRKKFGDEWTDAFLVLQDNDDRNYIHDRWLQLRKESCLLELPVSMLEQLAWQSKDDTEFFRKDGELAESLIISQWYDEALSQPEFLDGYSSFSWGLYERVWLRLEASYPHFDIVSKAVKSVWNDGDTHYTGRWSDKEGKRIWGDKKWVSTERAEKFHYYFEKYVSHLWWSITGGYADSSFVKEYEERYVNKI